MLHLIVTVIISLQNIASLKFRQAYFIILYNVYNMDILQYLAYCDSNIYIITDGISTAVDAVSGFLGLSYRVALPYPHNYY